jgi:hypothetical protein
VAEAFRTPFLVTGAAALLAALLLVPWPPGRRAAAAAGVAAAAVAAYGAVHATVAPEPVPIRDPCEDRPSVAAGGLGGFLQDRAYDLLDAAACRDGASREELVLALLEDDAARRYQADHGRDPRSLLGLLGL